jgi:hypothetical protein
VQDFEGQKAVDQISRYALVAITVRALFIAVSQFFSRDTDASDRLVLGRLLPAVSPAHVRHVHGVDSHPRRSEPRRSLLVTNDSFIARRSSSRPGPCTTSTLCSGRRRRKRRRRSDVGSPPALSRPWSHCRDDAWSAVVPARVRRLFFRSRPAHLCLACGRWHVHTPMRSRRRSRARVIEFMAWGRIIQGERTPRLVSARARYVCYTRHGCARTSPLLRVSSGTALLRQSGVAWRDQCRGLEARGKAGPLSFVLNRRRPLRTPPHPLRRRRPRRPRRML